MTTREWTQCQHKGQTVYYRWYGNFVKVTLVQKENGYWQMCHNQTANPVFLTLPHLASWADPEDAKRAANRQIKAIAIIAREDWQAALEDSIDY